ncbi:MAG: DNA-3-methyladenine glycosylase [Capsulimonadaceae bacterium]|nr:DNA-3-methyladenine glycosylase [Capsulimonadaceae bacterium]
MEDAEIESAPVPAGVILPRTFYLEPTLVVARQLIGKRVVSRHIGGDRVGRIVETEAYLGASDAASHAYRGPKERNLVMFGPPGHAYVYLSYGVHWMLNASTQPEGVGEAVLIRAIEPVAGIDEMRLAFTGSARLPKHRIGNGPGKLARALGITLAEHGGLDLCDEASRLTIQDDGWLVDDCDVVVTPRVGISAATDKPYRFYLSASRSVSRK